jgi:hypothetical protein
VLSPSLGQRHEGGPSAQMHVGLVTKATGKCASHMIKFASLGDSSCDTCEPSPPEKTDAVDMSMCLVAAPGYYSY